MTGRFVILRHEMPRGAGRGSHWDLMLEVDAVLRTWALEAEPRPGSIVRGDALGDHRLAYLEIEGPISGNRGTVARIDRGSYATLDRTETTWRVQLAGSKLQCELRIQQSLDDQRWTFTFGGNPTAAVVGTGG
ncbi:MAG TPA: DNA polymerase ligase N-terminal domain-containing protein [Pirellulales bacterium]|nr:DNA polymerase ligase N-terminal domain-containing protein [Pirellulales bacterium]